MSLNTPLAGAPSRNPRLPQANVSPQQLAAMKELALASGRIVLHLLGDDFAQGSKLEGSPMSPILQWVIRFLRDYGPQYGVDPAVIAECQIALDLAVLLENRQEQEFLRQGRDILTQAIDDGRPILIPGGWIAEPFGHAMYYEMFPQQDGTVALRIYNLGAGAERHAAFIQGGKTKCIPCIEWQGIPREKILDKDFLKAIYEMNTLNELNRTPTNYDPDDIYDALKASLSPTQVLIADMPEPIRPKTIQRSGLCALRDLMPFLASKLGPAYKPLKLSMELEALHSFTPLAAYGELVGAHLLSKSHQKLSRKVVLAARNGLTGQKLEQATQTLAQAKQAIEDLPESPTDVPVSFPFKSLRDNYRFFYPAAAAGALAVKDPSEQTSLHTPRQEKAYRTLLEATFAEMAAAAALAFDEENYEALELALFQSLPQLSTTELVASCANSPAQAQEYIETLGNLAYTFFKNCFSVADAAVPNPKRVYVLYKLLVTISALACVIDPRLSSEYHTFGRCLSHGPGLSAAFFDARMERDIQDLSKTRLISLPYGGSSGWLSKVGDPPILSVEENSDFTRLLYKLYPAMAPSLAQSVPHFHTFSEKQRAAHLLTSEHLPCWTRTLIDALAMWSYLNSGIVAPCTPPKNWMERPFDFSDIDEKGHVTLNIPEMNAQVHKCYPDLLKNHREKKYIKNYPPLMSPTFLSLFAVLQEDLREEKTVLCKRAPRDSSIKNEEWRELLHIISNRFTRIEELITYFTIHREKLKERDFQTLFRILLFHNDGQSSLLCIKTHPYLHSFLEKSYAHFLAAGERQTAIFFLQVARDLVSYFPTIPFYRKALDEVRTLLRQQEINPIEKALLSIELIGHLGEKEHLEEEEIGELLEAAICYQTTSLPPAWQEVGQEQSLRHALIVHTQAINAACKDKAIGSAIMQRIFASIYASEEVLEWEVSSEDPLRLASIDGRFVCFPSDAKWIGAGMMPLPRPVLEHPTFIALFPTITRAIAMENGSYEFTSVNGQKTMCYFEKATLHVEQQWGQTWMRHIPSSDLFRYDNESLLQSNYLAAQFTSWFDPQQNPEEIISCDPKTGKPCYVSHNVRSCIGQVERIADRAQLSTPSKSLCHFESSKYIHEWHLNQDVEIELPRFGLTFINGVSEEFPGYRLEAGRRIPSLAPFSQYLVLVSPEGELKLIIPRQFCHDKKLTKESLNPTFNIDRHEESSGANSEKIFVYDINGEIKPPSREAGLYLAYLFLLIQNYEQASKLLLQFGERPSRLKQGEVGILEAITQLGTMTGDQSGNGTVLRVQAALFLLKQQDSTPKDLFEDYKNLLEHAHHRSALTLAKEEEIFLCKTLLRDGFYPIIYVRLHELDPHAAEKIVRVPPVIEPIIPESISLRWSLICRYAGRLPAKPLSHITRAGNEIQENLYHFYIMARKGTQEQRSNMRACLPYLKYSQTGKYRTMAYFLEAVLDHPDRFRERPYSWGEDQWVTDTLQLADSLCPVPPLPEAAVYNPTIVLGKTVSEEIPSLPMGPLSLPRVPLLTTVPGESPEDLNVRVQGEMLEEESLLQELEFTLLSLANKTDSPLRPLEQWGTMRKVLTKDDLILAFGRRDLSTLTEHNPDLSEKELADLMHLVGAYLLHATRLQHLVRGKFLIQEERQYDPTLFPAYLVFEYTSDKLLYPEQVAILEDFLSGRDVNRIRELCMGSGKSKLLVPLLLLLRADGKTLSMALAPTALCEDLATDTHATMTSTSLKKVCILYFERSTPVTPLSLETIRDRLLATNKNKNGLLMTGKSFHCILLRYIELADRHYMSEALEEPPEVTVLGEILSILMKCGYPLLDEADTLNNVLHETSFSIGQTHPPDEDDVALSRDLYVVLYTDPRMRALCSLESDPSPEEGAPPLTIYSYFKTIKIPLAKIMIERLQIKGLDQEAALKYVIRDGSDQRYFDTLEPDAQNALSLLGAQICVLLPHTLLKVSDQRYGLDEEEDGAIASPFSAAKTPNHGSQFASVETTINCTMQIFTKKGVSFRLVEQQTQYLQGAVMKQLMEEGGQIDETEGWKRFLMIRGNSNLPLFNYTERQLQTVVDEINSSYERKLTFAQEMLVSRLQIYAEKLSANPLNTIALFLRLIGFTGTLWNSRSMHSKLTAKASSEIETKTLEILRRPVNGKIYFVKEGTSEELIALSDQFTILIDSGGYCKDADNETVALHLSEHSGQPVIYYNKENQQVKTKGQAADARYKAFLDQSHTTGSDVVLQKDAVGLVTVGEKMLLRDLLQAVWRLRGIEKEQTVHFAVSDRVKQTIIQLLNLPVDHEISLEDIILFTIVNQLKEQGEHNFIALSKELNSLLQTVLLDVHLNPTLSHEQKKSAHQILRSRWIQPAHQSAKERFGVPEMERPTEEIVQEQCQALKQIIEDLFTKCSWLESIGINANQLMNAMEALVLHAKPTLPPTALAKQGSLESTLEVEKELKLDLDIDQELSVETVTATEEKSLTTHKYSSLKEATFDEHLCDHPYTLPYFPISAYFERNQEFSSFATAFQGIDMTLNVLQWADSTPSVHNLTLFGEHRTPFHYLRFSHDGQRILIHSQIDQSGMAEYGQGSYEGGTYDQRSPPPQLYNLTLGWRDDQNHPPLTKEQKLMLVKIKFLNGNSEYSKEEQSYLQPWLSHEGMERMRGFYLGHILEGFPKKRLRYHGSALAKIFQGSEEEALPPSAAIKPAVRQSRSPAAEEEKGYD